MSNTSFQQRQCEGVGTGTSQNRAPPPQPSQPGAGANNWKKRGDSCAPQTRNPRQMEGRVLVVQSFHDANGHCGVSLLNHAQKICPTRPISRSGHQCGALDLESQATQRQRQTGQIPIERWVNPQKLTETEEAWSDWHRGDEAVERITDPEAIVWRGNTTGIFICDTHPEFQTCVFPW